SRSTHRCACLGPDVEHPITRYQPLYYSRILPWLIVWPCPTLGSAVALQRYPPMAPPPGVPADGKWVEERYCGLITWLVAVSTGLVCSYCCPCDRRTVWISDGVKFNEKGAVTDDTLCLNPCPSDS
ncbi:unnamed protein product, partial [Ascophyllum nodosum]